MTTHADGLAERISSPFTFPFKFILPTLWLAGFGIATVVLAVDPPMGGPSPLMFGAFLVAGALVFYRWGFSLKKVTATEDGLLVSNYFREVLVPYAEVRSVHENKVINTRPITVKLRSATAFGTSFVFMPYSAFVFFGNHPAATVLRDLVDGARNASARAADPSTPKTDDTSSSRSPGAAWRRPFYLRHRYLLAIAGWLVFSAAIILLLGNINAASYLRIIREGSTTDGVVIAREPHNHDSVVVRYTAGGIERVARRSFVAKPNSEKRSLAVGDKVIVFFLPRDPQQAVLGDPRHLLANELTPIALAATLFPTLLVVFFLWGTRARPRLSELRERVTSRGSPR